MEAYEIRLAVSNGAKVFWKNKNYQVIKDSIGQFLIWSRCNDHYIGLTWRDGTTLNGKPEDFFIGEE